MPRMCVVDARKAFFFLLDGADLFEVYSMVQYTAAVYAGYHLLLIVACIALPGQRVVVVL